MNLKDPKGVAECTYDEIVARLAVFWPMFYESTGDERNDFGPIVDGHWHVGFSLRLFGPPGLINFEPDPTFPAHKARAWLAMEQLQCALEDAGFETTRDGNDWQDGRLVIGWAIAPNGALFRDLPKDHHAQVERATRLARERAERAIGTAETIGQN